MSSAVVPVPHLDELVAVFRRLDAAVAAVVQVFRRWWGQVVTAVRRLLTVAHRVLTAARSQVRRRHTDYHRRVLARRHRRRR